MNETTKKINRMQRGLAFVTLHELDKLQHCKPSFSIDYEGTFTVIVKGSELTNEESRKLKRLFGPLKASDAYQSKDLMGKIKLDEDTTVKLFINRAYACAKADANDWDEEKWADFKEKARKGLIEVVDCEPVESYSPELDVEDPPF